jgi:hypothetical protein
MENRLVHSSRNHTEYIDERASRARPGPYEWSYLTDLKYIILYLSLIVILQGNISPPLRKTQHTKKKRNEKKCFELR